MDQIEDEGTADLVFDVSLTEWCRTRSGSDSRVELIGAFFREETRLGNHNASSAHFAERFDAFVSRPA